MAAKTLPTQEYLQQLFIYNPETGTLTWRSRPREHFADERAYRTWNSKFPGKQAGSLKPEGYWVTSIDHQLYKNHRLIWRLVTGREPSPEVDHRDLNPSNNRWTNLRESTHSQNCGNQRAHRNNRLKIKGVHFAKHISKFNSHIAVNRKRINLGYFDTAEEAKRAYDIAAKKYFGKFARA